MRKTLNLKLLAVLIVGTALLGIGVHFLHGFQVKRNAGALLERANRAEKDGKPERAAEYLGRYLAYRPGDAAAQIRYGLLRDDLATTPNARLQAYRLLDRALVRSPGRHDVRRRVVKSAMKAGLILDARAHLGYLLEHDAPKDGELHRLLGECNLALKDYKAARAALEDSIRHDPHQIESYTLLADLLRLQPDEVRKDPAALRQLLLKQAQTASGEERAALLERAKKASGESRQELAKKADEAVAALIANNPKSYRAFLARARYRRAYAAAADRDAALRDAAKDVEAAYRLAPAEADVLLAAGEVGMAQGRVERAAGHDKEAQDHFARAREYLTRGCARHGKDARMYVQLSELEGEARRPEEAIAALRRGVKELPHHTELLWRLANELITQGKGGEAREVVGGLEREHFRPESIELLRARLKMNDREWLAAARQLESAYPHLAENTPPLAEQAGLLLARCYEMLGDIDHAHAVYGRVAALNKKSVGALYGLGRTLEAMGRPTEALARYRELLGLPVRPRDSWLAVARLLIQDEAQGGRASQDDVKDALQRAEADAGGDRELLADVLVLRAEVLARQKEPGPTQARELLKKGLEAKDPDAVKIKIWLARVALEERHGTSEAALGELGQAEKQLGDRVELRLARANYLARHKPADAPAALASLAQRTDKFTPAERDRLRRGLAVAAARIGTVDEAQRLWDELLPPGQRNDLDLLMTALKLAIERGDEKAVEQALKDMQRIEGPEGTLWRYGKALHLMRVAEKRAAESKGEPAGLTEARSLLKAVAERRPRWSVVAYWQGRIEDVHRRQEALTYYLKTIQLGNRSPHAIRRAVDLLYAGGRYMEAHQVLGLLPQGTPADADMDRLKDMVSLSVGDDKDLAASLRKAEQAAKGSSDYRAVLWAARMQRAAGKLKEAEDNFRRAVALKDSIPDTWVALVLFLTSTGQKEKAEKEVLRAAAKLKREAPLALALCHAAVGQNDQAWELTAAVREKNPEDVPTLQSTARLALRTGHSKEAKEDLIKIIELKKGRGPEAGAARRALVELLFNTSRTAEGDYQASREALKLFQDLPGGTDAESESAEDLRTRAALLVRQRGRAERKQAAALLEKLVEQRLATPRDRFRLANIYDSLGDWRQFRAHLAELVKLEGGDRSPYLANYVLALARHGETAEARDGLARLEKLAPEALTTKEIQARLLHADGKTKEAAALLVGLADKKDANVLGIANLLERMKAYDDAERMFRKYARSAEGKTPESVLELARYLGRRNRTGEALDVCEGAWKTCKPELVAEVCQVVVSGEGVDPAHYERVDRWLDAARKKQPESAALKSILATLRNFQGRFADAEAIYREAVQKDGKNSTALNNLAWLLALQGRSAEALVLVQQALDVGGPRPEYLDTRGVIYLMKKEPEEALKDLNQEVIEAPTAEAYFHLARAHWMNKDRRAAGVALRRARELGLKPGIIHPLERAEYNTLVKEFNLR